MLTHACSNVSTCARAQVHKQHLLLLLVPAGGSGQVPASCSLLTNTTGSLPNQLQLQPTAPWPAVLDSFSSNDKIQLRSIAWLCIKSAAAWDAFGAATHELIHTGHASELKTESVCNSNAAI
jgi:hypothetical protein